MSILISSSIHKHACGLPIAPISNTAMIEIASVLAKNQMEVETLDAQDKPYEQWVKEMKRKQPKMLIIQVDVAYVQSLKTLKTNFEKQTLVAVCSDKELIETLVFDYGIDYVFYSENYASLVQLIQSLNNPFSPFYDHIPGIAYKNGLGELTKTVEPELKNEMFTINSDFVLDYEKIYLPFGYQIDAKNQVDILNGAEQKVLTDFLKYKDVQAYDAFYLKIPASKKALNKIIQIIEKQDIKDNFHVYPSCDVVDDLKIYQQIVQAVALALEIKKAGFFKRIFLNIKLNKLR